MFQESYMKKVVIGVGLAAIIALLAYTYSALIEAKYMHSGPTTITVEGEGEVFAKPDVASFSFNINTKEDDAVTAQDKASEIMEAILAYLKDAGVEEKDVKTQYYNLNPRYEYPDYECTEWGCPPREEPIIIGYQVTQSVLVKVKNIDDAGLIVSEIGALGAQNVSSISFTIDDEDALVAEAREQAIADAKEKAEKLANDLGVRIVRVNGFWEDNGGYYPMDYGYGGDMRVSMDSAEEMTAPKAAVLPTGENKVTSRVNISYEVR